MAYVDAILHIESLPALVAHFAAVAPERLDAATGTIVGFDHTPIVMRGDAALTYVRVGAAEAMRWRGTPGVRVLAETTYGPGAADALFAALFADPVASSFYDAVWPRVAVVQADGSSTSPPERFGILL